MAEAELRHDGRVLALPVIEGTEGDTGIDISALRSELGLITVDRGFGNTAENRNPITFIDGDAGILRYRGYPIEELAERSTFLEVAYLLSAGDLPTEAQLTEFTDSLRPLALVPEGMKHLFDAFPAGAHPMQVLGAAVSALGGYHSDVLDPRDPEAVDAATRILLAQLPTLVAWTYKHSVHEPYMYPRRELDYAANLLGMTFGRPDTDYVPDPVVAQALDILLILHADHEQNCSTSAVQLVGSSQANLFASVAAGIHALSGPLHGGANQAVIEMLEEIAVAGGNVSTFVARAKDKNDPFRLMGFGHRVYKSFDPRATIIKQIAEDILAKLGVDDPLLTVAQELEDIALADDYFVSRKLYPNVDFYSGIIYRAMGFPTEMFTVLFALGRLPGWIAQWRHMAFDPGTRIFRPRQVYTGPARRAYVPLDARG